MDWLYLLKCVLLVSGSLVLLALAALIYQVVMITSEVRVIVSRIEMVTNYRQWLGWLQKLSGLKTWYEKFRH